MIKGTRSKAGDGGKAMVSRLRALGDRGGRSRLEDSKESDPN